MTTATLRSKKKRNRLSELEVDEISFVDRGAVPDSEFVTLEKSAMGSMARALKRVQRSVDDCCNSIRTETQKNQSQKIAKELDRNPKLHRACANAVEVLAARLRELQKRQYVTRQWIRDSMSRLESRLERLGQ